MPIARGSLWYSSSQVTLGGGLASVARFWTFPKLILCEPPQCLKTSNKSVVFSLKITMEDTNTKTSSATTAQNPLGCVVVGSKGGEKYNLGIKGHN